MSNEISFELRGMRELERNLERIAKDMRRDGKSIVLQAVRFFAVSAARATPPQPGTSFKKLGQKSRFRPIVKTPDSGEYWYVRRRKDGSTVIFAAHREISPETMRRDRITAAIRTPYSYQAWSKSKKKFVFLNYEKSYEGRRPPKYDRESRNGRIPAAGAANLVCINVLKASNQGKGEETETPPWDRSRKGTFLFHDRQDQVDAQMNNEVRYASTIGIAAARDAEKRAENRMLGMWRKRLDKINAKELK